MAAVTIRKLNDDALRELKSRAKAKGRSAEAEMREILEKAWRGLTGKSTSQSPWRSSVRNIVKN